MPVGSRAHQLESFLAHSLKAVGRASRLECAAPDDLGSRSGYDGGDVLNLTFVLNAAGAGHCHNLCAAHLDAAHFDHGPAEIEVTARQLIRGNNAMAFLHSGHHFERCGIEVFLWPDTAKNCVPHARGTMN